MNAWKTGAAAVALTIAAGAGATLAPVAHGQDRAERDRPLVRTIQVRSGGSQIGVSVRDVDEDSASTKAAPAPGVIVDEVEDESPAAKAGVKRDDAIVEFAGEAVRSVRQFARLVQETPAGREVPMVILRAGQRQTMTIAPERGSGVTLFGDGWGSGDRGLRFDVPRAPRPPRAPEPPRPPALPAMPHFGLGWGYGGGSGRLGVGIEELTPQLGEYFGAKEGVLVRSIEDGSPAAKAGLKAGDVITSIDGRHVNDPADVVRAIERLDDGAEVTIEIVRDHRPQTVKGTLARSSRGLTAENSRK